MQSETINEARRQAQVCNSCRYCEGYCAVFPALHRERFLTDGDITQLANLCHNCRGCYYACQYTEPHEFAINFPKVLAEVRQDSWENLAYPTIMGKAFHRYGLAIALAMTVGIALLFFIANVLGMQSKGEGFYAVLSHTMMVAIFTPAFLFPLCSIMVSIRRYWHSIGGGSVTVSYIISAFHSAARLKNLAGGHGDGCNFEDEDKFSHARRHLHHAVMYGFLLCFASTSYATILHYVFDMPAPYPLLSMPKLLGISGGVLLSAGTLVMMIFKLKGDRNLSDTRVWGGEFGFIALLFLVSTSGLILYVLGNTSLLAVLLSIHLGAVLAFFILMPYSKMVHGFYRLAALVKEEQMKRNYL